MRHVNRLIATATISVAPIFGWANEPWGKSGKWEILIDREAGPGCLMETILPDGTKIRVGILPERGGGYFAAFNRDWADVTEGAKGRARFDFGQDLFEGETESLVEGEWRGGSAFFNNPRFLENFERRNYVDIAGTSGVTFKVSLTGTRRAVAEVLKCQNELDREGE